MSTPNLKLGGLTLPHLSRVDAISQSYEPIGGQSIFRALTGAGINQMTWQKQRVLTSGSGWMPAGLEALDYTQGMILSCITPKAIFLPNTQLTVALPPKRRSDAGATPWAVAVYPHGATRPAALSVAGNTASIAPQAGAMAYQVFYYP